jgi:hypothetical protein
MHLFPSDRRLLILFAKNLSVHDSFIIPVSSKNEGNLEAQWWNTRQQLVLNLFEKRFQVFLDVRKIASEARQLGKINSTGLTNEIIARGRFLFGPELVKELEHLHSLVSELEAGSATTATEIANHFDKIAPMFEPYLKMPQQMPLDMLRRILGPW